MTISKDLYETAQRVRNNSAPRSDERKLADNFIANYRPKRRLEATRDEKIYASYMVMVAHDHGPKGEIRRLLGEQHNLSTERIRHIVQEQARLNSGRVFHKIDHDYSAQSWQGFPMSNGESSQCPQNFKNISR